ncbi:glutaredoxin family protein [Bacillus sp. FJAT-50079]|uniref:glutaredoxin family protein n=1 Tax=Bacillus sp. FJAT-50079 TaxID=2833577 RepID=UPI001BCA15A1|nr:glutaredoxin family protein [Bacillus sp. FJAT-50079]MBS4210130.1 glutaredoxin family protein [Bacillus sp. FJAT-50079]
MSKALSVIVWSKEGCHYCEEVKQFLQEKEIQYETVDVTKHDERRDILEVKYGVRYVPVVEIGRGSVYEGVTELGIPHLEKALERVQRVKI